MWEWVLTEKSRLFSDFLRIVLQYTAILVIFSYCFMYYADIKEKKTIEKCKVNEVLLS